jgi:hypothetical protein
VTADAFADREFADPAPLRGYQLRAVRAYAREVLEEEGFTVTVHPDHLVTQDGRTFGLQTLLARCAGAPAVTWRQIVVDQVRALLSACRPDLLDKLDLTGAAGRVFPRLVDRHVIPPELAEVLTYARPLGGHLVELLVLEVDLTVIWLRDADVARIGPEALRVVARENLLAVRPMRRRSLAVGHGAMVHVLEGGGHTASQVLALPEVLRALLGTDEFPGGVLVAIPTKYELWLHPIVDHHAYAAYVGLYEEAVRAFGEDPGALSPYVHWWHDGELVQIMTERAGLPHVDDAFVRSTARIAEAGDERAAHALLATLGNEIRARRPE